MTNYKDSGVDIEKGDAASKTAYDYAKSTFASRKGRIAEPVSLEGGYSGLLDMGDFYLVQNDDGVGTKVMVAQMMKKYDTLGYDLLAMVCDDAVCMGAETTSITNTIDTEKVEPEVVNAMMSGLAKACREQEVVIAGGEIAELNALVNGFTWNASAIGVVGKNRVITGSDIQEGDAVIGLRSDMFRSNGMSLVRRILHDKFGDDWVNEGYGETSWGETVLTPSRIYSACVLNMIGRYAEESRVEVHGISHITGGGLSNLNRILKSTGLGVHLDALIEPHEAMLQLQEWGDVSDEEAYRTWNMGIGMILVSPKPQEVIAIAKEHGIEAKVMGVVTTSGKIEALSQGRQKGELLVF
jgi:phosphoribosylformylglycinamidine cyclo-ligase